MRYDRGMATSTLPKLHLAYVRVSTDEQAETGYGLADQEAKVRAHAFASDRELAEVIVDDGFSAKNLKRPGVQRILALVRAGRVGSVTVQKLDRLTRSVRDLNELLELSTRYGFALVSVGESLDTSTAVGRMIVNVLGTIAQWERETISERTKAGLAVAKQKGVKLGNPRNLTADGRARGAVAGGAARRRRALEENAVLLPEVQALREQGLSVHAIATRVGTSPMTVSRLLRA